MKQPSTFGMTITQLREFFQIGQGLPGRTTQGSDGAKRELVESRLAQNVPLDRGQLEQLPEVLSQLCQTMARLTGDTVGTILKDPSSDLETIRRVKRHAKRWAAEAASKDEHTAAAAVYYAAIAHALVFHDRLITKSSLPTLVVQYSRLVAEPWMPKDLIVLFRLARAYCVEKTAAG